RSFRRTRSGTSLSLSPPAAPCWLISAHASGNSVNLSLGQGARERDVISREVIRNLRLVRPLPPKRPRQCSEPTVALPLGEGRDVPRQRPPGWATASWRARRWHGPGDERPRPGGEGGVAGVGCPVA